MKNHNGTIKNAIIGSTGVVGKCLCKQINFDIELSRKDIIDLIDLNIDKIYVAAPSGNRYLINHGNSDDEHDFEQIKKFLSHTKPKKIFLVSTIDSIVDPTSRYGSNRLAMEQWVKLNFHDYYILRLSTLISKFIKKNILYDLKNQQFIGDINIQSKTQWCSPDDTLHYFNKMVEQGSREFNLVSEPILHKDILEKFYPEYLKQTTKCSSTIATYDQQPYSYARDQIFTMMETYLNQQNEE
jgi:hypothetical protein